MPTPAASVSVLVRRFPVCRARLAVVHAAAVLGVCAIAGVGRSHALDIWIVTDSRHPVTAPAGARVTELDAVRAIEKRLAQSLPSNPGQAEALARQRLHALTPELKQTLAVAYQGIVDAWSLGVTKVPAVIVDRRYVVYGEPNVERAVSEIARYRSTQR